MEMTSLGMEMTSLGMEMTSLGMEMTSLGMEMTSLGMEMTSLGMEMTSLGMEMGLLPDKFPNPDKSVPRLVISGLSAGWTEPGANMNPVRGDIVVAHARNAIEASSGATSG
jgi:hypothetical protein